MTIEGNGTIYCNEDTATIRSRGGNITVSDKPTTVSAALSYSSTGNLTINNSKILGGPYGANAITVYNPTTINLTGSTSLYTTNTSDTANVVWIMTSGVKVTFNSTGYFYGTGSYVAATDEKYSATYTVTKGHFVSRNNKYMFYKSGAADTNYASSSSPGNRNFVYMDAYNSTVVKVIPNCYYYTKGV